MAYADIDVGAVVQEQKAPPLAQVVTRVKLVERGSEFKHNNFTMKNQSKADPNVVFTTIRKQCQKRMKKAKEDRPLYGNVTVKGRDKNKKKCKLTFAFIFDPDLLYIIAARSANNSIKSSQLILERVNGKHLHRMEHKGLKSDFKQRKEYDWNEHWSHIMHKYGKTTKTTTTVTKVRPPDFSDKSRKNKDKNNQSKNQQLKGNDIDDNASEVAFEYDDKDGFRGWQGGPVMNDGFGDLPEIPTSGSESSDKKSNDSWG